MQIVNRVQFQYCWLYLVWDGISSRESELGRIRSNLPDGMVRALIAMALAQALVAVIALIITLGSPWSPPGVLGTLILNGFFVGLFVGSALLFRNAAREQPPAGTGAGAGREG
jgi:hypothetical protein